MQITTSINSRPTLSASFSRASRALAAASGQSGARSGTLSNMELKRIVAEMLG